MAVDFEISSLSGTGTATIRDDKGEHCGYRHDAHPHSI